MKLSKLFHSLYFMVMFLPLFIIPIFAININQKSVEPISIEVQEEVYTQSNYVETYEDIHIGNIYYWEDTVMPGEITVRGEFSIYQNIEFFKTQFPNYTDYDITSVRMYHDSNLRIYNEIRGNNFSTIYQDVNSIPFTFIVINTNNIQNINENVIRHIKYTDYKYSLGVQTVTYDDTDIGSQFLYSLYKPVRDYCNFSNYFGLNGIYDWFLMTFFNGTAPLVFFIFFNLMIYWLFISLLWLLFDVLIYVPMMIHRWLDKGALE